MKRRDPETRPPLVRISIGHIDPAGIDETTTALEESEALLRPVIAALPGLVAYYVGVDRDAAMITNTSIWETREDAMAMSTLPEMAELRAIFQQLGVVFEPVANYETLWEIDQSGSRQG